MARRLRKGQLTRKDQEKFLKSLPDVTDKIAPPEADDLDAGNDSED